MKYYTPESVEKREEMLREVGRSREDLFRSVPENLRFDLKNIKHLNEDGLSEMEVAQIISGMAAKNKTVREYDSYLGAGFYDHYSPSPIHHLISRQEYLTSYTPYQQEISQGTLQAYFEWQTYICRLTKMDISNASLYDGPSAAAEAALMALRSVKKANKIFVSGTTHPDVIETLHTYLHAQGFGVEVGEVDDHGKTVYPKDPEGCACFIVQSPNFYGIVEDLNELSSYAHEHKALAVSYCDPIALTLLQAPGDCDIDIAVGEAQSLGLPMSFGGPALGYMATKEKYLRKMPGRICGETLDKNGKKAYVLTLQAREQHIRREKATSNICTSQALMATAATIYMALNGETGMRDVAEQSAAKALYLQKALVETGLFKLPYDSVFFNEFLVEATDSRLNVKKMVEDLVDQKILAGYPVDDHRLLLAVTETKSKEQMDHFVAAVKAYAEKLA